MKYVCTDCNHQGTFTTNIFECAKCGSRFILRYQPMVEAYLGIDQDAKDL